MNINNWMDNEIEKYGAKDGYTRSILESAKRAVSTLAEDGHSGYSIALTKSIIDRFIDFKPLTPLTGSDDEWFDCYDRIDDYISYQNKRCTSFFKHVYKDGSVKYIDVDRFTYEDVDTKIRWHCGGYKSVIKRFFGEITVPYVVPDKPIVIYKHDFLYDPSNGDYDTTWLEYAILPSGERIDINAYLADKGPGPMVEITMEEYLERKKNKIEVKNESVSHSELHDIQDLVNIMKRKNQSVGELSDGYHTFNELYLHRMKLFSIICNTYKSKSWKSKLHSDGTMYDNMFIVGISTPAGDYSYHYDIEHWDEFDVRELEFAPEWDGHKPEDYNRLDTLL